MGETTKWYVSAGGNEVKGPWTEAEILAAIAQGLSPAAQIQSTTDAAWRPLMSHPAFAQALARNNAKPDAAPAVAASQPSRWWTRVTAIGSCTTGVALVAGLVLAWRAYEHESEIARDQLTRLTAVESDIAHVRDDVSAERTSKWVDAKNAVFSCLATNTEATCTVTNVRDEAITTCVKGVLTRKKATGLSLESLPMCTGRLGARETRTVSVPWKGGFARDLCTSKNPYGGSDVFDWDACDFVTEPVDVRSLESAAGTAPKAASSI